MSTMNCSERNVFKRIPYEIFELVEIMSKFKINVSVKVFESKLSGKNTVVVKQTENNYFVINKYNELGNLFEYTLKTNLDDSINLTNTEFNFPYRGNEELQTFLNDFTKNPYRYLRDFKYKMSMSKFKAEDIVLM